MVNSINSKPSLLYIDDAPEFLLLFQASLKNDYNITTADSAEKGLEFLKTHKIKIIVADQRMPGITGIELLEKVAKEYPDILRFMISAFTDFQSAVDGVNKGRIHGFFNKPINPDEIRIAIAKALEIQILREKNRKIMQELKETNIGLKNTNRNKTIFLQILSRQLSKPINDISGTVQALKDKIDSRELVNLVNLLDDSVSNLKLFSSLAQQITLLEINENKINFTSLNSRELVEYLIIEKTEQLNKRNIKINLQESKKKLLIHGDHYLVINCLINVLENAIQHTADNGDITINIGYEKELTFFEIIDQGLNYTENVINKMKTFFTTNDDFLDVNINLGFVLVKHIMDAHNGQIRCSCNNNRLSVKLIFNSLNTI